MPTRGWGRSTHLLLVTLVVACTQAPAPTIPDAEGARTTMAQIVGALQVALPLALDEQAFAAPENREALDAALRRLRLGANALQGHGLTRDAGFAHLSHSLAEDAAEIEVRLRNGRSEEARYLLNELVDVCVGCHSRLPGETASELGRTLFDAVDANALPRADRIRLELASRQFDRALDEMEALLAEALVAPAQLDVGGFLEDYLQVSIRVRQDLPRAARHLTTWRESRPLPPYLSARVDTWIAALHELAPQVGPGDELAKARVVATRGQRLRRFPADRRPLVHDLVVSSLLHRAIAVDQLAAADLAEAYYLLGVAELHTDHRRWLATAESYLEAAVRAAPGSAYAREAYLLLEEETLGGYGGSAGLNLPEGVDAWLDELRGLAGL